MPVLVCSTCHRLGSAGSLLELERIWEELNQSTVVKSDKKAKEVFLKRKEELSRLE